MGELLPCPFCGEPAEVYSATERRPDAYGIVDAHWIADCTECNANIELCWSEAEAIAAWNRRALPAAEAAAPVREAALREAAALVATCSWGGYWSLRGGSQDVSPIDLSDAILALIPEAKP